MIGDPTIYVVAPGNILRPIPSYEIYKQQYQGRPVAELSSLPSGLQVSSPVTFAPGALIKAKDDPTVYLVIDNNTKYAFKSFTELTSFGYKPSLIVETDSQTVSTIPSASISKLSYHAAGTFIKYQGDPTVYMVENNTKRPIGAFEVLKAYTDPKDIITVSASFQYTDGPVLAFPDGVLIKGSNDTVYLVSGGTRRAFTSAEQFTNLGYNFNQVVSTTDVELQRFPDGGNLA